jgi:tetratricopeptide (TPR) repeat protein
MDTLKKDSCNTCLLIFGMVLLIAQKASPADSSTAKEALIAAYGTGVTYFKAGRQDDAKAAFRQTAGEANCPDLIRICCFNMTGQIARLQGNDKEALEAFEQAAKLLVSREHNASPEFVRLLCSILFARGEIYEVQENYSQSISEYNRLIQILRQNSNNEQRSLNGLIPL